MRLRLGAAAILLVASLLGPTTNVDPANADVWVDYGPVPMVDAIERFPTETIADAQVAAEMAGFNSADFLGSFVDQTEGQVHIVASTERGVALATEKFKSDQRVEVDVASVSNEEASNLGDALYERLQGYPGFIGAWGADPREGGLFIRMTRNPDDSEQRVITEFAQLNQVHISVQLDEDAGVPQPSGSRQTDPSP